MTAMDQREPPADARIGEGASRIKVNMMPMFSTWIYQCREGPTHLHALLEELNK